MSISAPRTEPVWVDGPAGYSLALDGTTIVCRNPKGRTLRSVPKKVLESPEAERLSHVRQWVERHERECARRVESWLLGSLPVPATLISEVWPDPAWRDTLYDLYAVPAGGGGGGGGFLRGVDERGRIGVLDLDAESTWLDADRVILAHPVLIEDLDDVREFALELGITQRLPQLTRQVHRKPDTAEAAAEARNAYAGAAFQDLRHARGRARRYGFAIRGGHAVCRVLEGGRTVQARYWIGSDDPEYATRSGGLFWVDTDERNVRIEDVGPVAWSEGLRMAEIVHAVDRSTEEENQP
ncbi:DUF4132 domain-containing protein [Nocardiopsis halotolerans]|uniref:DUF4132 domain-containing protein n=1 Tax=Nocardiopsis halotolerans TaxID=124252 RepID=UPI0003495AA0|nr:DUF4132 domain-containing protein [Nocardiopsis halotolerans]